MSPTEPLRVALLARPGVANDRLREVIVQAGANAVLEHDPTLLEVSVLRLAEPQVLLVALDPVTEEALERFESVLFDPAVDVIYEEAELAASREGWEVARWQRHLVAKLQRHGDVLPPGREPDEAAPASANAPDELPDLQESVIGGAFVAEPVAAPAPAAERAYAFDPVAAEGGDGVHAASAPDGSVDVVPFHGVGVEVDASQSSDIDPVVAKLDASAFDPVAAEAMDFSGFESEAMQFAEVAAGGTEMADNEPGTPIAWHGESANAELPETVEASPSVAAGNPAGGFAGFGELTLDDGSSNMSVAETRDAKNRFERDLGELEERIAGLELVDDTPDMSQAAQGAVLVLAGIGGPDAVRQLLGALPHGFGRPVLVQQRLEGGRYDKLVTQMQRATTLPVHLAQSGEPVHPGFVYILPAAIGLCVESAALRFDESGDVLAALPAADSAVLMLSGADAGLVDAIMNERWGGAFVAGQAAEGCYDPTAANALGARGAETGQPADIAARLAARWAS